ncbi:MAG: XdhC family protein, partial [Calditrichia bacterium]
MTDILEDISTWLNNSQPFAIATVVQTWGSAPRPAGAMMIIGDDMQITGSVSGGCVESAVIEEALRVMETGEPRLLKFGVSDETAWSVGLACGGKIKVFVEKVSREAKSLWKEILNVQKQNKPCLLVKDLSTDITPVGDFLLFPDGQQSGNPGKMSKEVRKAAQHFFKIRKSGFREIEGKSLFFQLFPARSRLVIIGAAHIAIPLVKFARELDFETIIIDPRQVFADRKRFPVAPDKILPRWPA